MKEYTRYQYVFTSLFFKIHRDTISSVINTMNGNIVTGNRADPEKDFNMLKATEDMLKSESALKLIRDGYSYNFSSLKILPIISHYLTED